MTVPAPAGESGRGSALEVLLVALRLGLLSFGGPIAHIGYFHEEYVRRRGWLSEERFADLVALCQFLPGPASSQLGIAIGTLRAGVPGGVLAWLGFTLPSAVLLTAAALGLLAAGVDPNAGWVKGLLLAAVAVVAQAVLTMARGLISGPVAGTIAVAALVIALVQPEAWVQLLVILGAALAGILLLKPAGQAVAITETGTVPRWFAIACLAVFGILLAGLPLLVAVTGNGTLALTGAFYRAGSLVFGGGHVVLPLLEATVVAPGWVTQEAFLAGYGLAQAVPGPLFTFAAFLGAVATEGPGGVPGAALATVAIFLPSFLLVWGVLPWWDWLRAQHRARAALAGVNAGVVGILAAALYTPVFTKAVTTPIEMAIAAALFGALLLWKAPPVLVVGAAALLGALLLG